MHSLAHLWVAHRENDKFPAVPWQLWFDIFISRAKERALGIPDAQTSACKALHGVPKTDDFPQRPESEVICEMSEVRRRQTQTDVPTTMAGGWTGQWAWL
jgi:hypothetical protein